MLYPSIRHHGAVEGVTGSCHQLELNADVSLLIDCGAFQGAEVDNRGGFGATLADIGFAVGMIRALVITHVHADHAGRIPELLEAGFQGPILCSEPSAKMLPLVMEDALGHQRGANSIQNLELVKRIQKRVIALPFGSWFTLSDTAKLVCKIRLQRAGHILGSAYVEIDITYPHEGRAKRVVFSGDLGAANSNFLPAPVAPERADILVLESTYGDRLHNDIETRNAQLEKAIDRALADHGTVLIPAFSIGRTQELLYEIETILSRKKDVLARASQFGASDAPAEDCAPMVVDWPTLPVILDSPLASRFTHVYQQFEALWNPEPLRLLGIGRSPLGFSQLIKIDSHAQHLKVVNYLASTGRPAIVLAGNGMCSGGRIINYLKAMIGDSRHNVVFAGFQAPGTPGADIQKSGQDGGYVALGHDHYEIRAGVASISGYSAHADQAGLIEFVTSMAEWPADIRLVHGTQASKKQLSNVLQRKYSAAGRSVNIDIGLSHGSDRARAAAHLDVESRS